jgi:hypothetical protein
MAAEIGEKLVSSLTLRAEEEPEEVRVLTSPFNICRCCSFLDDR